MDRTITLNTGAQLPRVGLGVFRAPQADAYRAVLTALRLGYRHIDTAQVYGNEAAVGRAMRDSGLPREEIFVTTKIWNDYQRPELVEPALRASLKALNVGAPDLFLLHWPVPQLRLSAWRALEQFQRKGVLKAIGVSNFMPHHLEELLSHAEIVPAVNQVEVSPFLQQREVREMCARHGIVVQAYSPLTKGQRLEHPVVTRIGQDLGRTNAQVLLRWGLQHGHVVLPKSVNEDRIASNLDVFGFELGPDQVAELDGLEENLVTGWNPQMA